jgi:hypothetical protein
MVADPGLSRPDLLLRVEQGRALREQVAELAEAVAQVEREVARVHEDIAAQGGSPAAQAAEHARRAREFAAESGPRRSAGAGWAGLGIIDLRELTRPRIWARQVVTSSVSESWAGRGDLRRLPQPRR